MTEKRHARLVPKAAAALASFVILMSVGAVVYADPPHGGSPSANAGAHGNGNGNPDCNGHGPERSCDEDGDQNQGGACDGNEGHQGDCDQGSLTLIPPVSGGPDVSDNGHHGNPDCNGTGPERTCDEDGDHNQGGPCDGNERKKDDCGDDGGDDPGDPAKGSITLDKSGPAEAHPGEAIEYTFEMTNTGNGAITRLELTDTLLGITHTFKHPLTPHKSMTFSAVYGVPEDAAGSIVNEATVCGLSQGDELCATDTHTVVLGTFSSIEVRKSVNPDSVDPGQTVTYRYEVENKGLGVLSGVTVDDDVLGHIADAAALGAGETQTFTKDFTVQADSPSENTATACGTDASGQQVCDTDVARISILLPAGPRQAGDGKLPRTGFSLILWVASGLNLIALGLAMTNQRRFVKS
jgi:hypothetical protein